MLDKNGVEIKVGDKFVGFVFSDKDYPTIGYVEEMNNHIGKVLTVTHINSYSKSVCGDPENKTLGAWIYPAEQIEIIVPKVDKPKKSDTIKTSKQHVPKRTLWAVYSPEGLLRGAEQTRREARHLNRILGGGLQIHKMETVAKYKAKSN